MSEVTDKLWKKFYEKEFGVKSTSLVVERMKQKKVSFKWSKLYEVILFLLSTSLGCYLLYGLAFSGYRWGNHEWSFNYEIVKELKSKCVALLPGKIERQG